MNKATPFLVLALAALTSPAYATQEQYDTCRDLGFSHESCKDLLGPNDVPCVTKHIGHDMVIGFKQNLDAAARATFQRYNNRQILADITTLILESPILAATYPEVYAKVREVLVEVGKETEGARLTNYLAEADAVRMYATGATDTPAYEQRIEEIEARIRMDDQRFVDGVRARIGAGQALAPLAHLDLHQLIEKTRWHFRQRCISQPKYGPCDGWTHWY